MDREGLKKSMSHAMLREAYFFEALNWNKQPKRNFEQFRQDFLRSTNDDMRGLLSESGGFYDIYSMKLDEDPSFKNDFYEETLAELDRRMTAETAVDMFMNGSASLKNCHKIAGRFKFSQRLLAALHGGVDRSTKFERPYLKLLSMKSVSLEELDKREIVEKIGKCGMSDDENLINGISATFRIMPHAEAYGFVASNFKKAIFNSPVALMALKDLCGEELLGSFRSDFENESFFSYGESETYSCKATFATARLFEKDLNMSLSLLHASASAFFSSFKREMAEVFRKKSKSFLSANSSFFDKASYEISFSFKNREDRDETGRLLHDLSKDVFEALGDFLFSLSSGAVKTDEKQIASDELVAALLRRFELSKKMPHNETKSNKGGKI